MTTQDAEALPTFAFRGIWHIVRGERIDGPLVGRLYLFKCSRWAREADIQGIARGSFPAGDESCTPCREDAEGLVVEAFGVPGASSDEPDEVAWDPDAAPNRASFLRAHGANTEPEHEPLDDS